MATVLRLASPGLSSCVCASEWSSTKSAAVGFSSCSSRWNEDSGEALLSAFDGLTRSRSLVSERNSFFRSGDSPLYSSWRTRVAAGGDSSLASSDAIERAPTAKLTFLIDVEEGRDESVLFRFGTVDQVLAWDRVVAFLYQGAEAASSVKRSSTVCQELIGVADSGPTYYSESGVTPRWALMKEMLKDFSQAVPMDRQVVSRSVAPHYSAAAGVWESADGTHTLGGGSRIGRPGRRSPGWPKTHSVGGHHVSSLGISDWAPYPGLWRGEFQAYGPHPAFCGMQDLKLLDAPAQSVMQLKLQTDEHFSLQETKASYGMVKASTAFIWLPSQNEENISTSSVHGSALRTTKTKALQPGRVLRAPKASSSVLETPRRQQKRGIRCRKACTVKPRETLKPRDLCYKNPVHVLDFMLGLPFMQTKPSNAEFLLAMRKEYAEELAVCLNQGAVGLAGGGLAMLLYVASRMLCVNAMFDNGKLFVVIRGVGLLWLSAAMRSLRKVILSLKNECVSHASKAKNREQVARLKKELRSLSYKALGVMVLSVVSAV